MTETRTQYTVLGQLDLFGGEAPPAGLNRDEKVMYILERWPECRNDDRELMLRFWQVFDGMDDVLGPEIADRVAAWFRTATHPETIRRGRAGLQKLRTVSGALLPSKPEIERRQALDGAGPPRSRR